MGARNTWILLVVVQEKDVGTGGIHRYPYLVCTKGLFRAGKIRALHDTHVTNCRRGQIHT